MKLAIMSDIHANVQALDACLAHAKEHGVQQFAFLGDLVGYGGDPVAVLQRVRALLAAGALCVKGNHDEMAVSPPQHIRTLGDSSARWTHNQLDAEQLSFLDELPFWTADDHVLLVHASADHPQDWQYVYDPREANDSLNAAVVCWPAARYVFSGHVHLQSLFSRALGSNGRTSKLQPTAGVPIPVPPQRQWLATVGSVGQPRDGNPQAMYAHLDTTAHLLTFERVDYDYRAAAAAIRRVGLPAFFADRLEMGR